ncbi:MAG: molybdopterin-binding protein [Desulfitobacterium hafniense]|nr:molybdopterin-binding protein [Desulfitobacterium hafniense]
MKKVKTEDAVGMILCHDLTKIVPGEFKGAAFKKGHIVKQEDVEELLKMGKEHLYIWENDENSLHENEAALRIARAAAGSSLELCEAGEGKVNLVASCKGLLKINVEALAEANDIEEVVIATRHTNQLVEKNEIAAGTRVIPLVINKEKIERVEEICRNKGPLVELKPLHSLRTGLITTGNEVYHGLVQDRFGPVVMSKLKDFGSPVTRQILLPDDSKQIASAIKELIAEEVQMIIVTGGMSVDPDDATPGGVKASGAKIVSYGAPLFPGAMFLVAYLDHVPILGLPGCVMYHKSSVFDLVLPRVLAGEKLTRHDLTRLGHGGLCLNCPECHYPVCPFGKG